MRLVFSLRVVSAMDEDVDEDEDGDGDNEDDEAEGVACEMMGMVFVSVVTVCEFSST